MPARSPRGTPTSRRSRAPQVSTSPPSRRASRSSTYSSTPARATSPTELRREAVALLVLLAGAARTRLVAAGLLRRRHGALRLALAAAGHRGVERLDHDLRRLDDRVGRLGRHRGLFHVLGDQL